MTTPEEVTAVWGEIPERRWTVHTWHAGNYMSGSVDSADRSPLIREVIEALDKVRSRPAPLPDLQVGDRFTMGDDLCEVVPLQQWDHEASIRFRLLNGHGTSLMLPSEIAKRATDFKRPVWEPVPTK